MEHSPDNKPEEAENFDPLLDRQLNQMRTIAISAAGACLAIIYLIFSQGGPKTCIVEFALCAAVIAMPVWIGLWQFIQAYLVNGRVTTEDYKEKSNTLSFSCALILGTLSLFASLSLLIFSMSRVTAVVFIVSMIIMIVFIGINFGRVKKITDSK